MERKIKLLIVWWMLAGDVLGDHEHGESRDHMVHMSTSRVSRWHVHHKMAVPVHEMRMDCMGTYIRVVDISLIMTGSVCHINQSRSYVDELGIQIETCAIDDDCHEVKWNASRLEVDDCHSQLHNPLYFCSTYLRQYAQQCVHFLSTEQLHMKQVTALDIETECVEDEESPVEYSIITLFDQQPINLGHLMTKCQSTSPRNYLNIIGFVEASGQCPSNSYGYTPPRSHVLVKTLQQYVNNGEALVPFDDYQDKLSMRLICGNMIFPVAYDGLIPLSQAHGWLYYQCGKVGGSTLSWDSHWFNVTRNTFNGTHLVRMETSVHNHCSWGHKLLVLFLFTLLVMAICCEIFTLYRRDEILEYLRRRQKAKNRRIRVTAQPAPRHTNSNRVTESAVQNQPPVANATAGQSAPAEQQAPGEQKDATISYSPELEFFTSDSISQRTSMTSLGTISSNRAMLTASKLINNTECGKGDANSANVTQTPAKH